MKSTYKLLIFLFFLQPSVGIFAQSSYRKIADERADRIVQTLNTTSASKSKKVRDLIASQYFDLNTIQIKRDEQLTLVGNTNPAKAAAIKSSADRKIKKLHKQYLSKLARHLSDSQIEKVKDGMTYNVVPLTYANYLLQTPYLTQTQQDKIKGFLIEARELAMDGGSSQEKHAVFGKYKGRITNYLAAEGYNMKKESADWAKRRDTTSTAIEIVQSNKITRLLAIKDNTKRESVRNLVAHQYQKVQEIQSERNAKMAATKQLSDKAESDKAASDIWAMYKTQLDVQRDLYVQTLSALLNPKEIELVKNEMTENGLEKEYSHFLALLPNLTEDQKKQVYDYLLEARDNAMNVLTSKEKHQWFIKYRGRANNYLSKQGYDLRKATADLKAKTGSE